MARERANNPEGVTYYSPALQRWVRVKKMLSPVGTTPFKFTHKLSSLKIAIRPNTFRKKLFYLCRTNILTSAVKTKNHTLICSP